MSTNASIPGYSTTSQSVVASNLGRTIGAQVAATHLANNEPWWWTGFAQEHKEMLSASGIHADGPWFVTAWLAARRAYDEVMHAEFTQIHLSVNGVPIASPFHRKGRLQHCESRLAVAVGIENPCVDTPDLRWIFDLIEQSMMMGHSSVTVELGDNHHTISWKNAE
jgi:hypothetical protein